MGETIPEPWLGASARIRLRVVNGRADAGLCPERMPNGLFLMESLSDLLLLNKNTWFGKKIRDSMRKKKMFAIS